MESCGTHQIPPTMHSDQESSLGTQYSEFVLEAGHAGSLCLALEFQTPRKKVRVSIKYSICTSSLGMEPFSMRMVGTLLKFPDATQRPALQAGLS